MGSHNCCYEHDGRQCPKLGIYCASPKVEPEKSPQWWCAYHADPSNRGHQWADGQMLQAITEDIDLGKQSRGTAMVGRETDALVDRELERLDLVRRQSEGRSEFVGRCLAAVAVRKNHPLVGVLESVSGLDAQTRLELLEAGEDPDIEADLLGPEGDC